MGPDATLDLGRYWRYAVAALGLVLSIWASGHAIIYKRDPRAAVLWVGVAWLLPLAGAVLYFLLGVNRIRRWAESLRRDMERVRVHSGPAVCGPDEVAARMPGVALDVAGLARAVGQVAKRPLLKGNRIEPLIDGDQAYPAMIEAIGR